MKVRLEYKQYKVVSKNQQLKMNKVFKIMNNKIKMYNKNKMTKTILTKIINRINNKKQIHLMINKNKKKIHLIIVLNQKVRKKLIEILNNNLKTKHNSNNNKYLIKIFKMMKVKNYVQINSELYNNLIKIFKMMQIKMFKIKDTQINQDLLKWMIYLVEIHKQNQDQNNSNKNKKLLIMQIKKNLFNNQKKKNLLKGLTKLIILNFLETMVQKKLN